MNLIKVMRGTTETDIDFAEATILHDGEERFIIAVLSGELCLLVQSDISFFELNDEQEGEGLNCSVESIDIQNNKKENEEFSICVEDILAYLMESDFERYECWEDDGGEALYDASESAYAAAFIFTYDYLFNDFSHIWEMEDDGDQDASQLMEDYSKIEE